jgi:hypothetical protein
MNRARGGLEELAQSGWEDTCGGEEILLHIRHERVYKVKYYAEKMQPLFVFCSCSVCFFVCFCTVCTACCF